jgi:hypothetical protein
MGSCCSAGCVSQPAAMSRMRSGPAVKRFITDLLTRCAPGTARDAPLVT